MIKLRINLVIYNNNQHVCQNMYTYQENVITMLRIAIHVKHSQI
jgi:hypothetical protein